MNDENLMRRALELAERGRYSVSPNPMVGALVVRDGQVIGEGWHQRAGLPHAEIEALRSCAGDPRGATLYVTLEPCAHFGRTPPCSEALVSAGISRVVIAAADPSAHAAGSGPDRLRDAGVRVEIGLLAGEAGHQNEKFLFATRSSQPFVLLKAGITVDGKLATASRKSRWITGEEARHSSLELREEYDAILVGAGTVAADDPHLTRRLGTAPSERPWLRVVLDAGGVIPAEATVLTDGGTTLVFTDQPERIPNHEGVTVESAVLREGRVDLQQVLAALRDRGVQSLLVEGGSLVHTDFLVQRLWQKMILFVAPMFLGGSRAPSIFSSDTVTELSEAIRFRFAGIEQVGADLMIVAYPE